MAESGKSKSGPAAPSGGGGGAAAGGAAKPLTAEQVLNCEGGEKVKRRGGLGEAVEVPLGMDRVRGVA